MHFAFSLQSSLAEILPFGPGSFSPSIFVDRKPFISIILRLQSDTKKKIKVHPAAKRSGPLSPSCAISMEIQ